MPVVVRDGADLYWEKIGAGPALILGAGLNGSGKWWEPNRFALAERFTVYTFDQRGTGRSSKIPVASIEQRLRTWSRSWTTPVLNQRTTPAIRPAAALASPPCWISPAGFAHC